MTKILTHPMAVAVDLPLSLIAKFGGHWQEEDGQLRPTNHRQLIHLQRTGQIKTTKDNKTVMLPSSEIQRLNQWNPIRIAHRQKGKRRLVFILNR